MFVAQFLLPPWAPRIDHQQAKLSGQKLSQLEAYAEHLLCILGSPVSPFPPAPLNSWNCARLKVTTVRAPFLYDPSPVAFPTRGFHRLSFYMASISPSAMLCCQTFSHRSQFRHTATWPANSPLLRNRLLACVLASSACSLGCGQGMTMAYADSGTPCDMIWGLLLGSGLTLFSDSHAQGSPCAGREDPHDLRRELARTNLAQSLVVCCLDNLIK